MIYTVLLFIGIGFNIIAQTFLKIGTKDLSFTSTGSLVQKMQMLLVNPYFLASLISYGMGFIIYAIVLSRLELSRAYPVASVMAIICIYIISILFFNETNTSTKFIGILFCISGIILILK